MSVNFTRIETLNGLVEDLSSDAACCVFDDGIFYIIQRYFYENKDDSNLRRDSMSMINHSDYVFRFDGDGVFFYKNRRSNDYVRVILAKYNLRFKSDF